MVKNKVSRYDILLLTLTLTLFVSPETYSQDEKIKSEILKTGELIRAAFSTGDIETIKSFHHPEVIKALGYKNVLTGRDAVMEGLRGTLEGFDLEFIENTVESILIQGDIAIEQTLFSIKGTPKKNGEPFVFSGRTMVTYIKYKKSPTGWATIREIIQQATN
jgi:ketosteroid isomerase-like protein